MVKINPEARMAAFQYMPISFQSLVIESTNQCNARCKMCYQSAGPNGSDFRGKSVLSVDEIKILIYDGMKIETLKKNFHLTGGEAFLNIDECIKIFETAREAGYTSISTTTNAYWSANKDIAAEICSRLRSAGLTQMEISWDYWHQPYISSNAVSNALEACSKYGIKSILRLLSTHSHSAAESLESIERSSSFATEIYSTPVYPVGRSAQTIDPDDIYYTGDLSSTCHSILNLTVNPLGNVYPCCAGSEETDWLNFGNINEKSIIEISDYMNSSLLLRSLVFLGVGVLVSILENANIRLGDRFSNICHLCYEIFSKEKNAKIIQGYFEELEKNAILNSLKYFQRDDLSNQYNKETSVTDKDCFDLIQGA